MLTVKAGRLYLEGVGSLSTKELQLAVKTRMRANDWHVVAKTVGKQYNVVRQITQEFDPDTSYDLRQAKKNTAKELGIKGKSYEKRGTEAFMNRWRNKYPDREVAVSDYDNTVTMRS